MYAHWGSSEALVESERIPARWREIQTYETEPYTCLFRNLPDLNPDPSGIHVTTSAPWLDSPSGLSRTQGSPCHDPPHFALRATLGVKRSSERGDTNRAGDSVCETKRRARKSSVKESFTIELQVILPTKVVGSPKIFR